jgi:hypothetical protein
MRGLNLASAEASASQSAGSRSWMIMRLWEPIRQVRVVQSEPRQENADENSS